MAGSAQIPVSLVVAMGLNRVIGREGQLPWRLPSDLARFKEQTLGKPVVMGRKTYQSIGRPLPGRANIVITRDPQFLAPGCRVVSGLDPALAAARQIARETGVGEICVIGGAQIYRQALPLADLIRLTQVHAAPDGDAVFPDLVADDWRTVWEIDLPLAELQASGARDDHGFTALLLERTGGR
jgi:dihydrofolate reductase